MYTYIKGPATDTINFEVEVDDELTWTLDGQSMEGGNFSSTHNDSFDMVEDEYYNIRIDFNEKGGRANLTFYWNYTSQSHIVIPDSAFFIPTYVDPTPITIEVTCPANYTGLPDYSVCTKDCSNGKLDSYEQCEDGNLLNGDGCTENCTIEANWVCDGGSDSSIDT